MKVRKVRLLELFGGIGAIRKAFDRTNIPYVVVDYVENDKNCVKSYNTLYKSDYKIKDIRDYHIKEEVDFIMHGSPCQDFSTIGLKKGGERGSGTRSSLLFETIRIISEMNKKPTIVLWENVKGVTNKNMVAAFFSYLEEMEKLGYKNTYKILNAMDFGIPQRRERIFVVSVFKNKEFDFETLKKVKTKDLSEFLEKDVSDIYTVKQKSMLKKLLDKRDDTKFQGKLHVIDKYVYTISTKQMKVPNAGVIALRGGKYRYLTERECFRLMGFDDIDFNKLREVYPQRKNTTSSILYKQAGNSIVINVLEALVESLYNMYLTTDAI